MDPFIASIADFERLPIPGGVFELDGTITAANAAATRLLGRPAAQLVGRKAWDFAPGAEHIWDSVIGSARTADHHGEISIATPEGARNIHYVIALREHAGRSVALLFAVEIPKNDDHAQRVEALGMVAGGIAHDFNNQLVSVLAEATAARELTALPEAAQDSLRRIEAAAQRMALLTRQLLAYAGRGRFVSEVLDPDGLLSEMHEHLHRSVRPDCELILPTAPLRSAVEADRVLLREVIVNLVVNASEALSPTGGRIRVSTSQLPRDGNRTWWCLEVNDDGVGMDARTRASIFDPFFTTKGERHGLGLSAVHGIVRRLGGEISVDSKPGLGTTFQVRVPVIAGAEPKVSQAPKPRPSATSLRGLSILVADDEPSVRSTIRRLLERRGATVALASDGEEAVARLRDGSYSLILLDVMMPKLTGYQLLPIARKAQPAARVLLMSGYSDAARGIGGDDEPDAFLEKPFTAKQMDAMVDSLVDR